VQWDALAIATRVPDESIASTAAACAAAPSAAIAPTAAAATSQLSSSTCATVLTTTAAATVAAAAATAIVVAASSSLTGEHGVRCSIAWRSTQLDGGGSFPGLCHHRWQLGDCVCD